MFPVATTSQPNLFESPISSTPRARAWRFSSVRSRGRSPKLCSSARSNWPTIPSIAISRKSIPRLSASRCASARVPSDENREGIETPWMRSAPSDSTASAAVSAESIPPDRPTTISEKPFLST